ncbi:MAG: prepilin-type N-terminal cleavage/methylation domain-containing protein [Acidobacteria bacterium]|nr:prepilin-type N-terminal cleavage/methylation domain-containing protein [Acidobacteriota bacterium]
MRKNEGFTLIELMIVVAIMAIIAAVAAPGLQRARLSSNESSVVGSVRAINSAETAYAASCGGGGYAQSLADLGLPAPGGQPFVGPDLVGGTKSGYTLVVTNLAGALSVLPAASTCNGASADSVDRYHASAVPLTLGSTGQRSFASDDRGTIYQDVTGVAIANPIPAGTQMLQ